VYYHLVEGGISERFCGKCGSRLAVTKVCDPSELGYNRITGVKLVSNFRRVEIGCCKGIGGGHDSYGTETAWLNYTAFTKSNAALYSDYASESPDQWGVWVPDVAEIEAKGR